MAASDEIAQLGQELASLSKQGLVAQASKSDSEKTIPKIQAAIAAAGEALAHHRNNVKHMRGAADMVDLGEFKESCAHVAALENSLEMGKVGLAEAHSRLTQADEFLAGNRAAKKECMDKLKKFGRLLSFPKRTS